MKLVRFVRNKEKVKWGLFFETVKLNLEKGNAVFIGSQKDINEFDELAEKYRGKK